MIRDAILQEVRAIREDIAKEHDYDVAAIFDMLRQTAANSERKHVDLSVSNTSKAAQRAVAATDEATPGRRHD